LTEPTVSWADGSAVSPEPPLFRRRSDTAHWIAAYRARASLDPHALALAGETGQRAAAALGGERTATWAIAARTRTIDAMLTEAVMRRGVRTVVNLGAGLDARPQRLALGASVRWVEVDAPEVIAYKTDRLPPPLPCYGLERRAIELDDRDARAALLRELVRERTTLVLTEGLVVYFPEQEVVVLANDLWRVGVAHWIVDLIAPDVLPRLQRRWGPSLAESGAKLQFAPERGADFFEPHGFRPADVRPLIDDLLASGAAPRLLRAFCASGGKRTAVVRLERVG
jgi:methyltransferase (TIGR00027 family)